MIKASCKNLDFLPFLLEIVYQPHDLHGRTFQCIFWIVYYVLYHLYKNKPCLHSNAEIQTKLLTIVSLTIHFTILKTTPPFTFFENGYRFPMRIIQQHVTKLTELLLQLYDL